MSFWSAGCHSASDMVAVPANGNIELPTVKEPIAGESAKTGTAYASLTHMPMAKAKDGCNCDEANDAFHRQMVPLPMKDLQHVLLAS